jgi:hypothetical protein
MEKIAIGAPSLEGGFHRRRGDGLLEEAQRSLIGLQLPRHERSPASAAAGLSSKYSSALRTS